MKIIASTPHGFILDANKEEIYRLSGFFGSLEGERTGMKLEIGKDIPVSEMYNDARTTLDGFAGIQADFNSTKAKVDRLLTLMAPMLPKKSK